MSLSISHPGDTRAVRLHQDGDAADIRHIEDRPHQLAACLLRFGDAGIDVVDGEIGHPTIRHAIEVRAGQLEHAADILVARLGDPIGSPIHLHRLEAPADRVAVKALSAFDLVRHQLIPNEAPVEALRCGFCGFAALLGCGLCHGDLLGYAR
jgi:hypothetical protein